MAFTDDEMGIETEIAEQLDEIAGELNGIAEQLRRKPFAAIEEQLKGQLSRLGGTLRQGQGIELGPSPIADRLQRRLTGKHYEE
jgi:hypothetical protein